MRHSPLLLPFKGACLSWLGMMTHRRTAVQREAHISHERRNGERELRKDGGLPRERASGLREVDHVDGRVREAGDDVHVHRRRRPRGRRDASRAVGEREREEVRLVLQKK